MENPHEMENTVGVRPEGGSLAPFVGVALAALTAGSLLLFSLVAQNATNTNLGPGRGVVADAPPDSPPREIVLPAAPVATADAGTGVTGATTLDPAPPPTFTSPPEAVAGPDAAATTAPGADAGAAGAAPRDASILAFPRPGTALFSSGPDAAAGDGSKRKADGKAKGKAKARAGKNKAKHVRAGRGPHGRGSHGRGPDAAHARKNGRHGKAQRHRHGRPASGGRPASAGRSHGAARSRAARSSASSHQRPAKHAPPAKPAPKPMPAKHSNTRGKGHAKARGRGHAHD